MLVSGGSRADPRTPRALRGEPPPFLGTAVVGDGGLTAAIDAYGDVVDLRAPGPAGGALIDNPAARQAAGTVPAETGLVPRLRIGGGPPLPLWRADSVDQFFERGTNVVTTVAKFGSVRVVVKEAARGEVSALEVRAWSRDGRTVAPVVRRDLQPGARCLQEGKNPLGLICGAGSTRLPRSARGVIAAATQAERRWLRRAKPLAASAPPWAERMYARSLLVLRALTDRRSGAIAAGARDGWAYVWPRDAAASALAFAAAGYRSEARRSVRFLVGLDLHSAARFYSDGRPVPGRGPQGDAAGWVRVAAREVGLSPPPPLPWRNRPDYQEGTAGEYLGNAIAAADTSGARSRAESSGRLVRRLGNPGSGLDSAAAWAVEPFGIRPLFPAAQETMLRLARSGGRFGITPGEDWSGRDPWSAPTAWTAWSLAALAREDGGTCEGRKDRRVALRLLTDLRRAATPTGTLPERVDFGTGLPTSTTPLAWSHAFAILALRELWPG
jgi:Glycosyl hydrolases family 15